MCEVPKDGEALLEFGVGGGVAESEVGVAVGEDVAGDDEDVFVDGFLDELGGGDFAVARDFGESVEGAGGEIEFEVLAEHLDDEVALFLIG